MLSRCISEASTFLHVLLVLTLFSSTASAFFPTDWREKYFGKDGISHEAQTRKAYETLAEKYFPEIKPLKKTMLKARDAIAAANSDVDKDQKSSAKHFDGESFEGGAQRLLDLRQKVFGNLTKGNGEAARKSLGGALHTLQDFYAHTNWVELGNDDINYALGKSATLAHASYEDRTCNRCGDFPPSNFSICHDCRNNTNGFTLLTSGYYFGEDSPGPGVPIPDHKCHHGGMTDNAVNSVWGVFFGDVTPGINKDSNNCVWSPHHDLHPKAAALSIKATTQYIDDIMAELKEKERKLLFGVGGTLAFAIDTTASMADIIDNVAAQSIEIVNSRLGTPDEPGSYLIAPFNDPTTGPDTSTSDFATFKSAISSLDVSGGMDCPELSLTGMLDAMSLMDGPADLFVMTDASPKDFALQSQVVDTAAQKSININIFKFDDYCDETLSKRQDAQSDLVYGSIATATGGSYHSLPRDQVRSISGLLDTFTKSDSTRILRVDDKASSDKPNTYQVPVDSQMTSLSISLRGIGITISITRPDGNVLDLGSLDVMSTVFTDGQFITVESPASGIWTISVAGNTNFSFDVTGVTSLYLTSFDFVAIAGRPGHEGYFPIVGSPAHDHKVAAIGVIDGAFTSAKFEMRFPDGTVAVEAGMEPGSGEDGKPPSNSFYGVMDLVPGTLYAYCSGLDSTGAPFQRVLSSVFTTIQSNTTDTGINDTNPFAGLNSTIATTTTTTTTTTTATTTTTTTTTNTTSSTIHTPPYTNSSTTSTSYSVSYDNSTYGSTSTVSSYSSHIDTLPTTRPSNSYHGTPKPYSASTWTNPHTCVPGIIYTHSKYATGNSYNTAPCSTCQNANYPASSTKGSSISSSSAGYVTTSVAGYSAMPESHSDYPESSVGDATPVAYDLSTPDSVYSTSTPAGFDLSTYDPVHPSLTSASTKTTYIDRSAYAGVSSSGASSINRPSYSNDNSQAGTIPVETKAAKTAIAPQSTYVDGPTNPKGSSSAVSANDQSDYGSSNSQEGTIAAYTTPARTTTTTRHVHYTGSATRFSPMNMIVAAWTCIMAYGLMIA